MLLLKSTNEKLKMKNKNNFVHGGRAGYSQILNTLEIFNKNQDLV